MAIEDRTNWQQQNRILKRVCDEYDRKAVIFLASVGERVVKYAREHGTYTDRTGDLRNSIGYLVVQYGRIITENFSIGSGHEKGKQEARAHAIEVARELPPSKTYLVWVAGMEYARYVEAIGFDVIEGSGNWVESTAETLKAEFTRYLKSGKR